MFESRTGSQLPNGAWRNWQTRGPQVPVDSRPCGFESRRPDHNNHARRALQSGVADKCLLPRISCYVPDLAIGFATYFVVALLYMRRIGRVLLSLVLKAQE